MLSVLAPTSRPVEPFDPVTNIESEIATRAAVKVLQVQREAGKELLRLLEPGVGTRLNRRA
jgi:hypothetical protein